MSKKNHSSDPTTLRAAADAAVATWKSAEAELEALRTEFHAWARENPLPTGHHAQLRSTPLLLQHTQWELRIYEAQDRASTAERLAVEALDRLELEEGLEDARLRNLEVTRDDLLELEGEIRRVQAALEDAQRRFATRVNQATDATASTSRRRQAAGLPFRPALPGLMPGRTHVESFNAAIERGIRWPNFASVVADARARVRNIAADLEEAKRAEEAEAKAAAKQKAEYQGVQEAEQRRIHNKGRADLEAQEAERRRKEQLAADYQARQASGGAQ